MEQKRETAQKKQKEQTVQKKQKAEPQKREKRKEPKWKRELEQVKSEAKKKHDQLLRTAAEFENYKKRINKEFEVLTKRANEELIVKLLPILDNFERALDHSQTKQSYEALQEGINMVFKQLKETLEKEGLQRIEADGKPFDPNFHEAVMQTESRAHKPNIVVEELEKGYLLNGKVIRPAKVVVNKGQTEQEEEN